MAEFITDKAAPVETTERDWQSLITPEVIKQFDQDGVLVLRQALHPEWLLAIELGLERVMADSGQGKYRFFDGLPGAFTQTVRNFDVSPELQTLVYYSPIADIIGKIIRSQNLWYYMDEFFIKQGGGCDRTPWHQDTPYWPLEGKQIASAWISLDPLSKEECLEYVAGSHLGTMYDGFSPADMAEDPTLPHYGQDLPRLPDIEANRDAFNIVSWDIEPGDIIISHPGVLHGGGPTSVNTERRAITIRCFGDDVVFASRPPTRRTTPLTPGLALWLKPGDPLRSPYYPRLRPLPEAEQRQWM